MAKQTKQYEELVDGLILRFLYLLRRHSNRKQLLIPLEERDSFAPQSPQLAKSLASSYLKHMEFLNLLAIESSNRNLHVEAIKYIIEAESQFLLLINAMLSKQSKTLHFSLELSLI
ncbi:hypothetical protein GJ744_007390 [Endocarpon pusillum]|uniref:Uncharacterized protein n=1 Tax=Endocarpon pusillum TaxID=364733 RepID=A0A8H7AKM2_9EURO|nr:hypothetical protein GJ744_007390 [Endocarpon pusillum]